MGLPKSVSSSWWHEYCVVTVEPSGDMLVWKLKALPDVTIGKSGLRNNTHHALILIMLYV